jgi:hypothetical protein
MNRSDYLETAKNLYLYEHKTFVEISQIIPPNEKTIRRWAKEFGWFQMKKDILTKQKTSIQQAEYIAKKLGDKIEELLDNGTLPDTQLIQAYRGLVKDLKPVKEYSDAKKKEESEKEKSPELSDITKSAIAQTFK